MSIDDLFKGWKGIDNYPDVKSISEYFHSEKKFLMGIKNDALNSVNSIKTRVPQIPYWWDRD